MSLDALNAVWMHSEQKGSHLLVLLAVADNADDDGFAFPSYDHIAAKTRLGKRTVQNIVRDLLTTDELQAVSRGTWGRSNLYGVNIKTLRGKKRVLGADDPDGTRLPPEGAAPGGNPDGSSDGNQAATEPSGLEPSGREPSVETAGAGSEDVPLPGMEPPAPPLLEPRPSEGTHTHKVEEEQRKIEEVWLHYLALFGPKLRITVLTAARTRAIRKGLTATNWNVEVCKLAISGLKSYRTANPDGSQNIGLDVIFETGPHSRSNLTDQIEWWADQAADQAVIDPSVPSVLRDRIIRRRLLVVEMYQRPDDTGARERGEQAVEWLRAQAKEEPVVIDGRVDSWRKVT
jgi:hypothetical protein